MDAGGRSDGDRFHSGGVGVSLQIHSITPLVGHSIRIEQLASHPGRIEIDGLHEPGGKIYRDCFPAHRVPVDFQETHPPRTRHHPRMVVLFSLAKFFARLDGGDDDGTPVDDLSPRLFR